MKKTLIFFLFIVPMALSAQKSDYTLKGKIGKLNKPAMAYLNYRKGTETVRDSAILKNGAFVFKGSVDNPLQASLIVNPEGSGLRGKLVRSVSLYLEPGVIKITTPDSLANAKLTGPKTNTENEKLKLALKPTDEKMSAFMKEYYALPKEKQKDEQVRAALDKRYNVINDETKAVRLNFLKANPGSLISLDALKRLGGSVPDYAEVAPLFDSLSDQVKNSVAGKEYAASLEKMKATAIGAIAPEFSQNSPDGKPIKLSDFRGTYLLIDFWASWCGPCRAENPNVVKAYAAYHPKGFEILGVSLDNEKGKENWLKAIEKDELTWPQVSDLKYWENEVAKQYGVRAIPQNFLLDKDGKIVAKNLRGKALEEKLAEIFK